MTLWTGDTISLDANVVLRAAGLWTDDILSTDANVGLTPAGLWKRDAASVDANVTLPNPVYLQWVDEYEQVHNVTVKGWWDGTTEQPVNIDGWWDGAGVRQAKDETNPNGL